VYTGALEKTTGYEWQEFAAVPVSSLTRKILKAAADRNQESEIPLPTGKGGATAEGWSAG
jgi:hypothetical protein